MTDHERFSRAFLIAIGGMYCTDRGSEQPEGIPGVWIPLPAWLAVTESMRESRNTMLQKDGVMVVFQSNEDRLMQADLSTESATGKIIYNGDPFGK